MAVKRTSVILVCKHEMDFYTPAPSAGEDIWCPKCSAYKEVEKAIEQYNVKCLYCRFARTFGRDLSKANNAAGRHVDNYPTHRIEVKDGQKVLKVVTAMGDTLFSTGNTPVEARTRSQRALRAFEERAGSLPSRDPGNRSKR
jgi:hypothetical protein